MSRQSLRSQKISSFYNFAYDINNTTADKQNFINVSKEAIKTGIGSGGVVLVDKDGQRETTYGTAPISLGSNVGTRLAIGFDCATTFQDDDSVCIGTNNCKTQQGSYATCIGNNNAETFQDLGAIAIGSSNYSGADTRQGLGTISVGNNIQGGVVNDNVTIGNNITAPRTNGLNIGNEQSITGGKSTSSYIGTDISIPTNANIEYSIIGNDIAFTTNTTSALDRDLIIFGNNIKPANPVAATISATVIGNDIGSISLNSSFIIGNNSCDDLTNNNIISIGNYSLPKSETGVISIGNFNGRKTNITKQNNILIGSGINTGSSNSLIINTYSTDYEVSPDNLAKFILRCPIRSVNHGIGVNKLHYNSTTEELTYSTT